MGYDVSLLGFGDNVVDKYEHISTMYPGGNCVNVAVYARQNGAARCAYMGYFGSDAEAEHVIATLAKEQIETVKCRQLEGPNGCSHNTIIDGDRVFLHSNEGGVRGQVPYVLDRFDLEYIRQFDVVHSGNYSFTEEELKKIHDAGIKVSFDFSDDSDEAYYQRVAPAVDYAFCSLDGSDEEVKAHLKFIASLGPELVCVSRGAKGCMLYDGDKFYEQPAVPLQKVVDTMGAGDSLIATFLVVYTHHRKQGMDRQEAIWLALQAGAEFASTVCQKEGAFGYGAPYQD